MLKVHVAPKGVDAHELNRPRALGDGAVATDSIHSNGVVEENKETVKAISARIGGNGDHNIVDADVVVEDVAID